MKYTFLPNPNGFSVRTSDGVIGDLQEHADTVVIQPIEASVSKDDYTPVVFTPPPAPVVPYSDLRAAAYNAQGATTDALIIAMWKDKVNGNTVEFEKIQAIRTAIQAKYPAPAPSAPLTPPSAS